MVSYDLHVHTRLSLCSGDPNSTVPNFIRLLKGTSIKTIGISEHMWDSDIPGASEWYQPQDFDHICQVHSQIPEGFDFQGIRVLFGCESEFDMHGTLGITREHAQQLDFVICPHSHTHMKDFVMPASCLSSFEKHAGYMVDSFLKLVNHRDIDCITSIAHPFDPCGDSRHVEEILSCISDAQFEDCFRSARDARVGIELNAASFRNAFTQHPDIATSQYCRMYRIAKDCGCKFTYGSDSHSPSRYFMFDWMDKSCQIFGLQDEDFLQI